MRFDRLAFVLAVGSGVVGCATRAATPVPEPELPVLAPPPAPPRVVAIYVEPEEPTPVEAPAPAEPSTPTRPASRPPAPAPAPPPAEPTTPPPPPPALTLTPAQAKTEASIRALLTRVSGDLARVNPASLSSDGRTQFDAARRFVQQSEEALKARNLVYAGKLADKAAAMAAVLVR